MEHRSNSNKRIFFIIISVAFFLIICVIIAIALLKHTIQIRSDSAGVIFETDADRITYVTVKGQFPYQRVICPFDENVVKDTDGNVIETIRTYTMEAELSIIGKSVMSLNLDIETSDSMVNTYILKFADKDMKIVNGKVVE